MSYCEIQILLLQVPIFVAFWWHKIKISEINQSSAPRRVMLHWHCSFSGISSQFCTHLESHTEALSPSSRGEGSWGLPPHQSNIAWLWAIIPKPIIHFSALHSSPPDPLAARLLSISHTRMYTYTHTYGACRCYLLAVASLQCVCSVVYLPGEAKASNNNKEAEYPLQEKWLLIF